MKLTNYSDYALRSLIYLAVIPKDGELANIDDIAHAYNISKGHLSKIIHQLGKLGYIQSVRGKGGGICLAKDPSKINIGKLIRHTESDFGILQCLDDNSKNTNNKISLVNISDDASGCTIFPACHLKGVFHKAMLAFVDVLDSHTLADILVNDNELLALLDKNRDKTTR